MIMSKSHTGGTGFLRYKWVMESSPGLALAGIESLDRNLETLMEKVLQLQWGLQHNAGVCTVGTTAKKSTNCEVEPA